MRLIWGLSAVALTSLLAGSSALSATTTTYQYDELGRLWVVTYANGNQIVYSYDPAGNRSQIVTQTPANMPPVANDDTASTHENTQLHLDPRQNDTDADGDPLTITAVTNGAHGTATFTATSVTYTPTTGYSGPDTFAYAISDGHYSSQGNVHVSVGNSAPVANNDSYSNVPRNQPYTLSPNALANDTDPEGDPLSIVGVGSPSNGSATFSSPDITYAPNNGFSGTDSFPYTISDGHGHTASATITINMSLANNPPTAKDDTMYNQQCFAPCRPSASKDVVANDTDPDGDPLTVSSYTQGQNGAVSLESDHRTIDYLYNRTVNGEFEDTDTFTYTVSDGHGGTDTANVTVSIIVSSGN